MCGGRNLQTENTAFKVSTTFCHVSGNVPKLSWAYLNMITKSLLENSSCKMYCLFNYRHYIESLQYPVNLARTFLAFIWITQTE